MPKDLSSVYPIVEALYFTLDEKNNPKFNKAQIVNAVKKKTGESITRQTIIKWEKEHNWKLSRENIKIAMDIGDKVQEGEMVTYGKLKVKDVLKTQKLGYNGIQSDINEVLKRLLTEKKNYIISASEIAQEVSAVGRVLIRIKFHQFMKAVERKGVDKVDVEKFFKPSEVLGLVSMQNQFVKQMVGLNTKDVEIAKLTKEQRNAIIETISEFQDAKIID